MSAKFAQHFWEVGGGCQFWGWEGQVNFTRAIFVQTFAIAAIAVISGRLLNQSSYYMQTIEDFWS